MFKKMYNLTLNEIIKQYKKKSIVIISILILISAIGVPFLVKGIESKTNSLMDMSYGFQMQGLDQQIAHQNSKTPEGKVTLAMLNSQKAEQQILMDNKVTFDDWRMGYASEYLQVLYSIDALNLIKQGINPQVVVDGFGASGTQATAKLEALAKGNLNKELTKLEAQKAEMENNIKTNNYLMYLKEQINTQKKSLDGYKKEIAVANTSLKKNPDDKKIKASITELTGDMNQISNLLSVNEFRYDNKIPYNNKDWKSNTLSALKMSYANPTMPMVSEAEYMAQPHKVSYQRAKAKYNENLTNTENQRKLDWYSLKNNIAQSQYTNSSRDAVNSFVGIYVIIITIFVVIIAGGIVSSEFSKNTIKLLMIRPVSRFKILLSKLITPLIIGYVLLILSIVILTITSGAVFGFGDLGVSVIKMSGGQVVTENYIVSLILETLFYSISLIFSACLAFVLSTVTKSTAVSVAVTIVVFIGSLPLALILLHKNMFWLAVSPIPYICLPSVSLIKGFSDMMGSAVILNTTTGAIEIAVLAIIFAVISFAYFMKKDIKL